MSHSNRSAPGAPHASTLDELFRLRVAGSPGAIAYRLHDHHANQWQQLTWAEVAQQVARWQAALAAENLQPGDRIAISMRNGPEWVMFDQAALALGLVVVPLYPDDRPDSVAYCLRDAGAVLLLLQDMGRWRRIAPALDDVPSLQRVIVAGPPEHSDDARLISLEKWLPADAAPLPARGNDPHALATLVYTSGTAGRPKGVMLSHENILSVTRSGLKAVKVGATDHFLSFLPLSHMYERTVGYYLPMMAGASVAYARSINQLAEDLLEQRPTILISVPRLLERIHSRIEQKLANGPALSGWLFRLAVASGWHHFERQQGHEGWHPLLLLHPLLQRLVGTKIARRFGGRLRFVVSGGAPLPFGIARTFIGLGVPILQGYGLSESSPQVCVNRLENNDPHSVGTTLEGIEVRIGNDDELLVRGPGVMLGYWNNPAATASAIDPEGWLHTGDQGAITEGHLHITGRIKDILVLSNGEKVPPAEMESAIVLDPLFEQVLIVGEGQASLGALIVLNSEQWETLAELLDVDPRRDESLSDRQVVRAVLARIARQLHDFPGYAKVRHVQLMREPWTMENGLMTPTLKLKRNVILERYARELGTMWN
jgi:long-chain acyl-CoA synthetase